MDMTPTKRNLMTQLEQMIGEIVDQKIDERIDLIENTKEDKEFDINEHLHEINDMIGDYINYNVTVEIST